MGPDHRPRLSDAVFMQLYERKAPDETINEVVERMLDRDPDTQAVRNALDDLQTAAEKLDGVHDFDADIIRESTGTLRDELGVENDD